VKRAYLLTMLVFGLLLVGLATAQARLLAMAIPLVVLLLAGFASLPGSLDLQVERSLSAERILSGDRVTVTLTVTNRGSRLGQVLLDDHIPAGLTVADGSNRRLVSLGVAASITWSYTLSGQRGYYSLKKLTATAWDALGLVALSREVPTDGQLFVLPPVLRLRRVAIKPRRTRIYAGTIPARQGGPGVEFYDVRPYQSGDPHRWINWRVTARHAQELFTNEFEQERAADVGIVLDGRRRTNDIGTRSIFEHSVLAAASLADAFLHAGNRVGLLFYGRQIAWTMPGYGKLQGERILHDLSRLEVGDSQTFSELYLPKHLFPSHSQLVLVSPLTGEDYESLSALRMRGFHLLVVSPDPVAFEAAGLAQTRTTQLASRIARLQRAVLLRRLRGAGIRVVDWDVSQPFEKIAKRYLEQRQVLAGRGNL
jgi:uncharacterized protein (DUF58 family)